MEENLIKIKKNIQIACEKTGRKLEDIQIIAVTKTIQLDVLQQNLPMFLNHGITVFGENRVQEMLEKQPNIKDIQWHMIGNLQRNKVKYIVDKVTMIHSLDSLKLAAEINRISQREGVIMDTLIEVNIAGEDSKHGVAPDQVISLAKECLELSNVKIKGLMTVAPYVDDPEDNRVHFQNMYDLSQKLRKIAPEADQISMGMTGDYAVAIEQGATMVRIGTGIFGER